MDHLKLTLLISSFVIPLILAVTLLVTAKKDLSRKVMGLALLNAFFVFLANYFYFQKLFPVYSAIHSLHIATVLWIFPSVYLYVKTIVVNKESFRRELVHLVPGLVFGMISATLFYGFLDQGERIYYLSNYRNGVHFSGFNLRMITWFRSSDVLLIVAQVIFYSVKFFRLPVKYNEKLNQEYSNIDNFSLDWLKWFNMSFVLVGLLSISFYIFNPFRQENDFFLIIFLFTISAFIWIVGIWSFKQEKAEITEQPTTSVSIPNGNVFKDDALEKRLLDYFEMEKPFLNPELNLTIVCREIGTNRSYLSSVINNRFEMNFNAFVNQYRVQHIQEYLQEHPDTSRENLVQIAGFGSISSLKRALGNSKSFSSYPAAKAGSK
ncbi:MAG TPA: helix-turn-helix domain-containing protein [Sunxiuqinia sp.]|nr:helix-turn-helix domain-containing protein [Sunxiuqinia sp.]